METQTVHQAALMAAGTSLFEADGMSERSLRGQPEPRAGRPGMQSRKPPLHRWRVAELLVDTLQTIGVMTRSARRTAILLALLAATVAVVGTLDRPADVATTPRLACYIALANDLEPLMKSGLPDQAAGSAECDEALASTKTVPHVAIPRSTETAASRVGTD
jgi:hypothetical protein